MFGVLIVVVAALVAWRACSPGPITSEPERAADSASAADETSAAADPETSRVRRRGMRTEDAPETDVDDGTTPDAVPTARLEIVCRAPEPGPFRGKVLLVQDEKQLLIATVELDDAGRAVVDVEPGLDVTLIVGTQRFLPWTSEPFRTEPGVRTFDVELALGLEATGRVIAFDGVTPAEGVPVWVWSPAETRWLSTHSGRDDPRVVVSDAAGRFRVRGLRPGRVNLDARVPEELARFGERAFRVVQAGDRGIELRLWRTILVQFEPIDAATKRGLRTTKIELIEFRKDGPSAVATAGWNKVPDVAGEPVRLPQQPWKVWGNSAREFQVRALGYWPSKVVTVDPAEGDVERVIQVEMTYDPASVAVLEVTVVRADGVVPEWVTVTRFNTGGRGWSATSTRTSDGVLRLDLLPGPVHLGFGVPTIGVGAADGWISQEMRFDLESGDTVSRRITLAAGGRIQVIGPEGEVGSERPDRVLRDGKALDLDFDFGSRDGVHAYTCGAIPPGAYILEFDREDAEPVRLECTVRAHETTVVRLPER